MVGETIETIGEVVSTTLTLSVRKLDMVYEEKWRRLKPRTHLRVLCRTNLNCYNNRYQTPPTPHATKKRSKKRQAFFTTSKVSTEAVKCREEEGGGCAGGTGNFVLLLDVLLLKLRCESWFCLRGGGLFGGDGIVFVLARRILGGGGSGGGWTAEWWLRIAEALAAWATVGLWPWFPFDLLCVERKLMTHSSNCIARQKNIQWDKIKMWPQNECMLETIII